MTVNRYNNPSFSTSPVSDSNFVSTTPKSTSEAASPKPLPRPTEGAAPAGPAASHHTYSSNVKDRETMYSVNSAAGTLFIDSRTALGELKEFEEVVDRNIAKFNKSGIDSVARSILEGVKADLKALEDSYGAKNVLKFKAKLTDLQVRYNIALTDHEKGISSSP